MKFEKGDRVWLRHHEGNPDYLMTVKGVKFNAAFVASKVTVYWVVFKQFERWGEVEESDMVELTALDRVIYT